MKSAKLTLLLLGLAVLLVSAAAPLGPPAPVTEGRVPITYWANKDEFAAYKFLVELHREQQGKDLVVETTIFSPNSAFQAFMEPVFGSWIVGHQVALRDREIRDMSAELNRLDPAGLKMARSMLRELRSMRLTNDVPPLPEPAPPPATTNAPPTR